MIAELRGALSASEKRNEEINREFQKLLRQKEVIRYYVVFTSWFYALYRITLLAGDVGVSFYF